jgi:hypothetical protein
MYQVQVNFTSQNLNACSRRFTIKKAASIYEAVDKAEARLNRLKIALKIDGGHVKEIAR